MSSMVMVTGTAKRATSHPSTATPREKESAVAMRIPNVAAGVKWMPVPVTVATMVSTTPVEEMAMKPSSHGQSR